MKDFHRFPSFPILALLSGFWERDLAIDEKTMKDFHRLFIVGYSSTVSRLWKRK